MRAASVVAKARDILDQAIPLAEDSYGEAAVPYLKRAVVEAKNEATRREAEKELRILQGRK